MEIRVLESDEAIAAASTLMCELRPHVPAATFVETVRALQRGGYVLAGGFDECGALVTLAGYRFAHTLSRGPHLFVDDLVTSAASQKRGHASALLAWLGRRALERGVAEVWLDSRATARGFYEQVGFEMKTSIPCAIAAEALAARGPSP